MSKIVIIAVFIFWAAFSFFYANSLVKGNLGGQFLNNTSNIKDDSEQKTDVTIELAKHNVVTDCWLLIDNKIYNVTDYINLHPGGANEIIKNCGQDATAAFSSKDKMIPQDHSATAYALLKDYYIGDVSDFLISGQAINNNLSGNTVSNQDLNKVESITYSLTKDTVAQHNNTADCWVTSGNNVYNVTAYIRSHPGGAQKIIDYCGADVAAAFAQVGHSANASNILASYKIGILGAMVDQTAIEAVNSNISNTGGGGDEDEREDEDDD